MWGNLLCNLSWITLSVAVQNSVDMLPNYFTVKLFLQLSVSICDRPAFNSSASIPSKFIGFISFGVSASKVLKSVSLSCGCFCFNWFQVLWFNRAAPFWILLVKSFMAFVKFALVISWVNFLEKSMIADDVFDVFKSFWVVFPLSSDSSISLYVPWSMNCSNAFEWSLDFSF